MLSPSDTEYAIIKIFSTLDFLITNNKLQSNVDVQVKQIERIKKLSIYANYTNN